MIFSPKTEINTQKSSLESDQSELCKANGGIFDLENDSIFDWLAQSVTAKLEKTKVGSVIPKLFCTSDLILAAKFDIMTTTTLHIGFSLLTASYLLVSCI